MPEARGHQCFPQGVTARRGRLSEEVGVSALGVLGGGVSRRGVLGVSRRVSPVKFC